MSLSAPGQSPSLLRRPDARGIRWLALILLCLTGTVSARDYRVELILFENRQAAGSVLPGDVYYPPPDEAIGLDSDAARAAGFTHLADTALTLQEEADRIASTGRYRLMMHTAWQQPGLDNAAAIPLRFALGGGFDLYLSDNAPPSDGFLPARMQPQPDFNRAIRSAPLVGNIKVRLGRFLHLDVSMVFTDVAAGRGYRLSQSRKMRSGELHYIDNERFGLLAYITPVEDTDETADSTDDGDTAAPAPDPAPDYEASPSTAPGAADS